MLFPWASGTSFGSEFFPRMFVFVGGMQILLVTVTNGNFGNLLVTWITVLVNVWQTLQETAVHGVVTYFLVPQTSVVVDVPQTFQVSLIFSFNRCPDCRVNTRQFSRTLRTIISQASKPEGPLRLKPLFARPKQQSFLSIFLKCYSTQCHTTNVIWCTNNTSTRREYFMFVVRSPKPEIDYIQKQVVIYSYLILISS